MIRNMQYGISISIDRKSFFEEVGRIAEELAEPIMPQVMASAKRARKIMDQIILRNLK
jgi:hypothetical protein